MSGLRGFGVDGRRLLEIRQSRPEASPYPYHRYCGGTVIPSNDVCRAYCCTCDTVWPRVRSWVRGARAISASRTRRCRGYG